MIKPKKMRKKMSQKQRSKNYILFKKCQKLWDKGMKQIIEKGYPKLTEKDIPILHFKN